MQGRRAQQASATAVHVLGETGQGTGNVCALNPSRDPNARRL
jgi:hypothetical protein